MKKINWLTHKTLYGNIATSTCLIGGSAGLIFGISAGTFSIKYFNFNDPEVRLNAATNHNCYSQNISSQWNMFSKGIEGEKGYVKGYEQPLSNTILKDPTKQPHETEANEWWKNLHKDAIELFKKCGDIDPAAMEISAEKEKDIGLEAETMRKKYGSLVIDGAAHAALDRSFNQSLNDGLGSFIKNHPVRINKDGETQVYKPSQDNTQEFINVYREAAKNSRVICLAGFNHVTPLTAIGKMDNDDGRWEFGDDKNLNNTGLLLIDGDIPNNQNIASVLFRSDQPAFLTSLATCMYFFNNLDIYHANYRDMAVAAYGGNPLPAVVTYMGGFQRGIEFFNKIILEDKFIINNLNDYLSSGHDYDYLTKIIEHSKYKAEIEALKGKKPAESTRVELRKKLLDEYSVKMIKLGDFGTHFTGSFAAGDAIGISKQFLNRGASAIIAVAGPQSLDTAQEIMNQKSPCIVIGVDSVMEDSDYQKPFGKSEYKDKAKATDGTVSNQANNIIKFSAIKDMTSVTEKILRLAAEGKNWDISNNEPWKSTTKIPEWTEKDEIPVKDLRVKFNGDEFTVTGLNKMPEGKTVLSIPTKLINPDTKKEAKLVRLSRETPGTVDGFNFNSSTLKGITTFKINGTIDITDVLYFDNLAFNFENMNSKTPGQEEKADEKTIAQAGFKYIDFSLLDPEAIKTQGGYAFNCIEGRWDDSQSKVDYPSAAYHKGVIKFSNYYDRDLQTVFEQLFPRHETTEIVSPWAIVEAHPYKSIGAFGFKTCGNIENGLISISWDGWAYLVEALKQLDYVWKGHGSIDFNAAWQVAADEWIKSSSGGTTQFREAVAKATANDLSTFSKDSLWYKNYPYMMTILGIIFNNSRIKIPKEMTVLLDDKGAPHMPTDDMSMSILDWLEKNMYFIS